MRDIVITGATGFLGRALVRALREEGDCRIIAATSSPEKAESRFAGMDVEVVSNEELLKREDLLGSKTLLVHSAFCRKSDGEGLAQSLELTRRLFQAAADRGVRGILNLSSQSVYGSEREVPGCEEAEVAPSYLYSLAKYASEELLKQAVHFSEGRTFGCSVRLASLMGISDGVPANVLTTFIRRALAGEKLSIVGGTQRFSFLDVRDAAAALRLLLLRDPADWRPVYNLGPESQTGIVEMAELVCKETVRLTGIQVQAEVREEAGHELNTGMDSRLLYKELDWKPRSFEEIVRDMVAYIRDSAV